VPKGKSVDSAEQAFLASADKLASTTITQEDVDRAKNALGKQVFNFQSNTENFCIGLAEIIGAGDWRLFYLYRDRLEKLTLADVQAALHKYYLPSNRTWGVFIPDKSADTARVAVAEHPNIDFLLKGYTGRPTVAKTETFEASIPNIKKHTDYGALSNGMKYALLLPGVPLRLQSAWYFG
jgi:zinc protease